MGGFCAAVALSVTLSANTWAIIIVLKNGRAGEGEVVSKDSQEIVFQQEGVQHEAHLPLTSIAKSD